MIFVIHIIEDRKPPEVSVNNDIGSQVDTASRTNPFGSVRILQDIWCVFEGDGRYFCRRLFETINTRSKRVDVDGLLVAKQRPQKTDDIEGLSEVRGHLPDSKRQSRTRRHYNGAQTMVNNVWFITDRYDRYALSNEGQQEMRAIGLDCCG
jgi:hypothetical protein